MSQRNCGLSLELCGGLGWGSEVGTLVATLIILQAWEKRAASSPGTFPRKDDVAGFLLK